MLRLLIHPLIYAPCVHSYSSSEPRKMIKECLKCWHYYSLRVRVAIMHNRCKSSKLGPIVMKCSQPSQTVGK